MAETKESLEGAVHNALTVFNADINEKKSSYSPFNTI